jgi:hypothetical protein
MLYLVLVILKCLDSRYLSNHDKSIYEFNTLHNFVGAMAVSKITLSRKPELTYFLP